MGGIDSKQNFVSFGEKKYGFRKLEGLDLDFTNCKIKVWIQ